VNDFEVVPVAPIYWFYFVVQHKVHSISIVRSLYFKIFSNFLSIAFTPSSLVLLLLLLFPI